MTKDWMNSATKMDYTAFDINYASFRRGQQTKLKKMIRRKARRNAKLSLDKQFNL